MVKRGIIVGAVAGVSFWLADSFIPTTGKGFLDSMVNVAVAAASGAAVMHFMK